MGRDRDTDPGRPVEPGEARAHGSDPEAVEVRRTSDREERPRAEGLGPDIPPRRSAPTSDRRRYEEVGVSSGGTAEPGVRRFGGHDEGLAAARRDSTRWGPIWAGLITALTTFLLLQLLAIGTGLQDVGPGAQGAGGWVPAVIGLIAFFIGGLVAGITSAIRGAGTGLLHGFLVWALGTVLILVLSALGLGQLFGALGNVAGQLGPGGLRNAAGAAQANAPNVSPQEAAQAIRTGAIGAFFGLLLSALASMLGGFLGGRTRTPIGHTSDRD